MDIGFDGLWKGIGDTFTAGKDVNLGQMAQRAQKRQLEFDKLALDSAEDIEKYKYLSSISATQNRIYQIVIIAVVLLISIAFYLKFRNK